MAHIFEGIQSPDSDTKIQNSADSSKQLGFDLSSATTSTATTLTTSQTANRTITLPNATDTLVGKTTTDTLTNKTINSTTNTVTADNLHSATTTVNVASSIAPTSGQVLTATSSTAATWQSVVGAPVGSVIDFAGTTAPTGWILCFGQAISRITFADLFAVIGTTYGVGDGSTTYNLPDLRGRAIAGKDNMGGVSANRLTSALNGDILGTSGGNQNHTLTTSQIPIHNHLTLSSSLPINNAGAGGGTTTGWAFNGGFSGNANFDTGNAGGGATHNNTQPTFILNKIIKS